jgi:hypothetical protein
LKQQLFGFGAARIAIRSIQRHNISSLIVDTRGLGFKENIMNKSSPLAVISLRSAAAGTPEASEPLAAQRQLCRLTTRNLGAVVADEYTDVNHSGRSGDRPGLNDLLDRLEAGDVAYVVIPSVAHLARDRDLFESLTRRIEGYGARVIAADEPTAIDRKASA